MLRPVHLLWVAAAITIQAVTDEAYLDSMIDDAVSAGRRGGGASLSTSGSFVMSANRAGNDEEEFGEADEAMPFALAESNSKSPSVPSAPDWIGGCKTPGVETASSDSGCPAKCLSGDASHTECAGKCAHKWDYASNKGPYLCKKKNCKDYKRSKTFKKETLWCPKEVQTNAAKALQSIKGAGGKFHQIVMTETRKLDLVRHELKAKGCKPSKYGKNGETKPVPLKFMTGEPHRKYTTDSKKAMSGDKWKAGPRWSHVGKGIEMYPWVTPGVSNCSPDTPTNFINYFEELKSYANKKDKLGDDCYKISKRKITKDGKRIKGSTAELLHEAGRCKFNIAGKKLCAVEQSFFCAKTYALTTEVYETIRVDKMKGVKGEFKQKSKYFTVQLQVTMKMRKANMCERMWRHLPYTCGVKKITEPIAVIVKGCVAYDGGSRKHNSGPPPKALCDHYKKYFPAAHQMNSDPKEIPDFTGSVAGKWKGYIRPAPSIPHVATVETAVKAFVAMK